MGSSAIEFTADVVLNFEPDMVEDSVVRVQCQKARHAEKRDFKLIFQGHINRFENYIAPAYSGYERASGGHL